MSATTQDMHQDSERPTYTGWRILVPLDETPQARRALVYAQALARATRGELKLLRASAFENESGFGSLATYAEHLREIGIPVQSQVVEGQDAESAILAGARSWRSDLIVMATRKWSGLDRWLSGSVTDAIIRSATVPVLVVPPDWERPFGSDLPAAHLVPPDQTSVAVYAPDWPQQSVPERPARMLVALDGSRTAEQALVPVLRLVQLTPANLILLRVVRDVSTEWQGADEYVRRLAAKVVAAVPGLRVNPVATAGDPVQAILNAAREFDVDAIAISTRGSSGLARAALGSTATAVLEQASVPVMLVGPHALHLPVTAQIQIRAPVRTLDNRVVGEVHRVVVDLEQHAIVSVVVLGRGPLSRDVLVPVDFIDALDDQELELRLTSDELEQLPDFSYNDFVTPPPETWTSFAPATDGATLVPVSQRKRLGPTQQDITPGTRVRAQEGDIGTIDRIEVDPTGRLVAFWVRAGGVFATDMRLPAEWIRHTDADGNLLVAGARADIEAYLGHESRARLGR